MRACWGYGLHKLLETIVEWFWESQPERVKAPYTKSRPGRQDPEYHETRGTLWEVEENQLSPGSIGISPLSTPHPHPFQLMWVRSSIAFYGNFNLDMDRSPGFGSAPTDSFALLRLGFPSAPHLWCLTLPASATRRTVLQKVRG